jgi:F-type H+-transporting ATPase subunit delta
MPADRRIDLLDRLIEGRVNAATRRLLEQVVRAPRGRTLERAIERLVELAAARRERYVAYVRAPTPLTEEQEARLAAVLARIYGRAVVLRVEVVPELLGGLVVRINDEVIDGSLAGRLAAARQRLAG